MGSHTSLAMDSRSVAPQAPVPSHPGTQIPGTSGGSKGLHSQSSGKASHPGRCHWGPDAGFSSGSLRAEKEPLNKAQ